MGWPAIPTLIYTDSVQWLRVTGWTQDAALGRVPFYATTGATYACSVQPESAEMVGEHGRQGQIVNYTVTITANPGFKVRDQLVWLEGARTLIIVGVHPTGDANGRIYVLDCQEHPTS